MYRYDWDQYLEAHRGGICCKPRVGELKRRLVGSRSTSFLPSGARFFLESWRGDRLAYLPKGPVAAGSFCGPKWIPLPPTSVFFKVDRSLGMESEELARCNGLCAGALIQPGYRVIDLEGTKKPAGR